LCHLIYKGLRNNTSQNWLIYGLLIIWSVSSLQFILFSPEAPGSFSFFSRSQQVSKQQVPQQGFFAATFETTEEVEGDFDADLFTGEIQDTIFFSGTEVSELWKPARHIFHEPGDCPLYLRNRVLLV